MTEIHIIGPIVTNGPWQGQEIEHLVGSGLRISHSTLSRGPASIESEFDEALAVPDIIANAVNAERGGADAIIIDCMADPGLNPVREMVSIPVLGPGETSMHLAAMLGHKFSIVTVLDSVKPMLSNCIRKYGVDTKLASILAIDIPVLEIHTRPEEVQKRLAETALQAVERDGADVIVLGCTGFIGCAAAIQRILLDAGHDLPVIDPIPATVCMAEAVVKAGLHHSKRAYPRPRSKTIVGFELP